MSKKHCIFKPLNFDVFIGMDVDKRSISITVLTHEEEVMQRKLPYSSANLLNLVGKRFADKRIAFVYEAGPTGYGLYDDITAAGFTCLVVSPASTPTAPSDRVKTNRLDSRKLAENLRGAQLESIHVPSIHRPALAVVAVFLESELWRELWQKRKPYSWVPVKKL